MFTILLLISVVPILVLTNLPQVPLWVALTVTTLFMVFTSGRVIVAINMINGALVPAYRGAFMSINASVQQMSAGLASFSASLIVAQQHGTPMTGYATVGVVAFCVSLLTLTLAHRIRRVGPPAALSASP